MITKVLKYGSSVLRKHSTEINKGEDTKSLIENLFDTLSREGGIGLAAPQIGALKRVFVMDSNPIDDDNGSVDRFKRAVINPEIISKSDETVIYSEGCLSIPEIYEEVVRPKKISVKYLDESFKQVEREIDGIEARIFQHEFDHLDGVLFVDRISSIRRKMLAGKLKRIMKISKR
ncbi:MAG TPA: peptide deformylase [Tenuifilaceae bacterium]|nr:peptide deformylase [Tenuifilaceae bacterium]